MANAKYLEFKNAGLCISCGDDRWNGKVRCELCHSKHLGYQEKAKSKAIARGDCRYCLISPRVEGRSMCGKCLIKHGTKQKQSYHAARAASITAYGGRCRCCGTTNQKYLQLDHVNSDGADHKRELYNNGRAGSMYTWALRNDFPDRLQLLCANCHQAKTSHGGCTIEDHAPFRLPIL
jgi:hypothetical protein